MEARDAVKKRGKHRRMQTDRKIRQTALDIALSCGIDAVTIKSVSRKSGVATTTIYRRYKNTQDLMSNLFMPDVIASPQFAELKPSKHSLVMLISGLAEYLEDSIGIKAVGALAASESEFFRPVIDTIVTPARNKVVDYFTHGVRVGVFRSDLKIDPVLDMIFGSIVAHALFHGDVSSQWCEMVTDYMWPGISAT